MSPFRAQVIGEIVWLMSQSTMHKQFVVADLEWLVMTPVILQQFRMFYQDAPPEQGGRRPIGVILWGTVSPEIDAMLTRGTTRMRPQDWKSGDTAWVEAVVKSGGSEPSSSRLRSVARTTACGIATYKAPDHQKPESIRLPGASWNFGSARWRAGRSLADLRSRFSGVL